VEFIAFVSPQRIRTQLGPDHYDQRKRQSKPVHLARKLKVLGYEVDQADKKAA